MLKLYRFTDDKKEYWETWDNNNGTHSVHWGTLGTQGESRTVKSTFFKTAQAIVQEEIDGVISQDYRPIEDKDHITLLIEYAIEGMGTETDVKKRHRLETRMNETLGWTGLGACDGGSIGSGTMEVCNYVVDFETAKSVIENDLADTEFSDFTRIFDENA
jgi:hypothetical protein